MQLLSQAGLRGIFTPSGGGGVRTRSSGRRQHVALGEDGQEEDEDDDNDPEFVPFGRSFRRERRAYAGDRYPKVPSEEGQKLMGSGKFGACDRCDHTACGQPFEQSTHNKRRRLARRMFDRELGVGNRGRARVLGSLASQDLIPSSKADMIINLNDRCYSGQFSEDGSFFFACGQDFKVRMYDTSNPYDWRYYKTVNYYGGTWTITDATLSPDNKYLATAVSRAMYVSRLQIPQTPRSRDIWTSRTWEVEVAAVAEEAGDVDAMDISASGRCDSAAMAMRSWPARATFAFTSMTCKLSAAF